MIEVKRKPYFYDKCITRHLVQVMAAFSGLTIKTGTQRDGSPRIIDVPVIFGDRSNLVKYLEQGGNLNGVPSLPVISVKMTSMTREAPQVRAPSHTMRQTWDEHDTGTGEVGNQQKTGGYKTYVEDQFMPIPYTATYEIYGWCSNLFQCYALSEQIMSVYNPDQDLIISNNPGNPVASTYLIFMGDVEFNVAQDEITTSSTVDHTFRMVFESTLFITPPSIVYESDLIDTIHVSLYEKNKPVDLNEAEFIESLVIKANVAGE